MKNNGLNKEQISLKARQMMDVQRTVLRVVPVLPWLAALVFTAALVAGVGTLYMVGKVSSAAKVVHTQEAPNYRVKREPLAPAEYDELVSWLTKLHPEVQLSVQKKGGLQVSAAKGTQHAEWLYTLAALQSNGADVIWDVNEFCVGRCNGPVASALVTGYRQKLVQAE